MARHLHRLSGEQALISPVSIRLVRSRICDCFFCGFLSRTKQRKLLRIRSERWKCVCHGSEHSSWLSQYITGETGEGWRLGARAVEERGPSDSLKFDVALQLHLSTEHHRNVHVHSASISFVRANARRRGANHMLPFKCNFPHQFWFKQLRTCAFRS